jgi:hypothetical protein
MATFWPSILMLVWVALTPIALVMKVSDLGEDVAVLLSPLGGRLALRGLGEVVQKAHVVVRRFCYG